MEGRDPGWKDDSPLCSSTIALRTSIAHQKKSLFGSLWGQARDWEGTRKGQPEGALVLRVASPRSASPKPKEGNRKKSVDSGVSLLGPHGY